MHKHQAQADEASAPESCSTSGALGRPASAIGLPKPSRVFRDDCQRPAPTMKPPKPNRWLVALAIGYLCFVAAVGCDQVVRYYKQPPVVRHG